MSFDTSKPDLYEQVTQALITALEEGAGEYRMPWHSLAHPVNVASQKAYRGINTLLRCSGAGAHHKAAMETFWRKLAES